MSCMLNIVGIDLTHYAFLGAEQKKKKTKRNETKSQSNGMNGGRAMAQRKIRSLPFFVG